MSDKKVDNSNEEYCSDWNAETKKNTISLAKWTGAWLITMAIATFGSILVWPENDWLKILSVLVNLVIGVGVIVANKRHLQGLDEMQQKIHLDAMALALGVGLIGGLSYSTLDVIDVISFDAEISHLVMVIGVTYLLGVVIGQRRYQ